ncbi:Green-sensitive opsin-1 [Armadillidium vulgare]|nr:Green-sensitive opsin-1 [Armadillidium vulgare]
MFALGLVFPVLVMGFSYANIIKSIKQVRFLFPSYFYLQSSRSGIQSSVSKAEGRIAAMVFVMGVTFLFAWTPYAVFALIMSFGDQRLVTPEAAVAPAIFAKSSCIYNPIIYVGLNTQFRSAWKGLMCGVMDELPKNITVQQSLSILSEEETSAKVME